jgi:hypothetical protein
MPEWGAFDERSGVEVDVPLTMRVEIASIR